MQASLDDVLNAIWKDRVLLVKQSPRRVEDTHRLRMHPRLLDEMKSTYGPNGFAFHINFTNSSEAWTLFGIGIVEDSLVDSWTLEEKPK